MGESAAVMSSAGATGAVAAAAGAPARTLDVLILSPSFAKTGGVANYVRVAQARSRHRVEVALRGSRGERSRAGVLLRMLGDYRAVAARLLRRRPDVVHQNTSFGRNGLARDGLFALLAKARGARLVVFFHGWDRGLETRLGGAALRLFRACYFRADAMVVLAESFRDRLREWGYRGPVYVETTMVDDALLEVGRARRPRAEGPVRVLYMARVERAKGIYDAIDVFARLRGEGAPVELVVAGEGTQAEAARGYAEERGGGVSFLGHVTGEAKARALADADLYLLASHTEGMPTTVLEAMAAGLPVVTSAVGGLVDFFEDGRMGYIVPPRDLDAFAAGVRRLAEDAELRAAVSARNLAYAADRFVASRVVARVEGIYEAVTAGHGG